MSTAVWSPGQAATWLYQPRGGYGYVIPVNATIINVGPRRVRIAVERVTGERVERRVSPERLRERGR